VEVSDPPPYMMTSAEIRAQLDGLVVNAEGGGFVGYGELHSWA